VLVPPEIAPGLTAPAKADYVCLKCGRPYYWIGNPPTLQTIDCKHISDKSR
jgi:DNA-directed RNA polymerase subunit RPC12/RpoP